MSLRCQPVGKIPEETMRVARAAFPKPNVYMQMRDELGTIYEAQDFEQLFPHSIGFSGRQRSLFCQGQLDPWFSVHTLSSTTQLSTK